MFILLFLTFYSVVIYFVPMRLWQPTGHCLLLDTFCAVMYLCSVSDTCAPYKPFVLALTHLSSIGSPFRIALLLLVTLYLVYRIYTLFMDAWDVLVKGT